MRTTITIGRQLGSGGSYVGRRLAATMGLRYLDSDVLRLAAAELHCTEAELAGREERVASLWEKMLDAFSGVTPPEATYVPPLYRPVSDTDLFHKQIEIMQALVAEVDCVIIGRAAAHVLPRTPGLVNVFLHAPVEFRVRRVREIYAVADEAKARAMIEESDAARQRFVAQMTSRQWLNMCNYDIALDASVMPQDDLADVVADYVRRRLP